MDLFSLTCTTCKSRLKVRDEGAIGHILACPKCGGMVMVKPPAGWQSGSAAATAAAPASPAESPAGATAVVDVRAPGETRSASHFDAVEDLLSDAPPPQVHNSSVSVAADAPGLARPRFVGAPPHVPAKGDAPTAESDATSDLADEALPPPDWQPQRPRRYWVLLAGSVAGGIALTVAVVLAINASQGDSSVAALVPGPGTTQPPPATSPTQPTKITTPAESPTETPIPPAPLPPAPLPPVEPPPDDENPAPPMPPVQPTPPAPPPPAAGNPAADINRILAPDDDPLAPPPVESSVKPAVPPPDPDLPPDKPALPRPEQRTIDVAARLADPLPLIETDGTPLADFLQVFSELSTIPITLEPDALPLVRASAAAPVTLKLSNTTLGAALANGLAGLKLETVEADGQLIVRLVEPSPLKSRNYAIKDLAGGDAQQAEELAELIRAVIQPASWGEDETAGAIAPAADSLAIRQSMAVHAQLIMFCEKLRTARGQKHLATWLDPALFSLASRSQLAGERLATSVTLNFSQPTSVVRILKRLEEAGGVRILVDWRDVAAAGWNPDGEVTLSVDKQPLATALTALVGPMDLAWRIVDGQTLQIVRPETLAARCELEFFQVGDLLKNDPGGDSLLALLRPALGDDLFQGRGGPCDIRCDAAGQCLIASLPQPKQQELEALLAKWRSEKK